MAEEPANESTITTEEDVAIDGERAKLHCTKIEIVVLDPMLGKRHTIRWVSSEVPIFGLVKLIKLDASGNEIARTEVLQCGDSGGSEKPLVDER